MDMARKPFKMKSGNSPLKVGGLLLNAATKGQKLWKFTKNAYKALAVGDTAFPDFLGDYPDDMSMTEKRLRTADEWITWGALSKMYDGMDKAFDQGNINMNDPKNKKYAEWYYGSKGNENANKSTQIKPGDKIEAISTD
tara:strand:+ start:2062 stop:2478 length:417 start_codon:yes stop_codon:yes gene_type:complete